MLKPVYVKGMGGKEYKFALDKYLFHMKYVEPLLKQTIETVRIEIQGDENNG